MIRFIHCADLHLGIKKYGKINPKTGINTRIEEDLKQFDKIVNFAIKKECNYFFIAGDIFDKRKPEDIVKREFAKRLKKLKRKKIVTVIVIGNHEGVTATDTAHCLSSEKVLSSSRYLYIVDDNKVVETDDLNIICMPYYDRHINFLERVKYPSIVIGHLEMYGAKQGEYTFKNENSVNPKIFNNKNIVYVALGHIHNRQKVGKAIYSGSINRINFGDEHSIKGFIYGNMKGKKCIWKFIQLKSRRFKTIRDIWSKKLIENIKEELLENTIIKVIVFVDAGEVVPIYDIKKAIINKGGVIDSVVINSNIKKKIRDKKYAKRRKPEEFLRHYLLGKKERTIKRGLKILEKVKV